MVANCDHCQKPNATKQCPCGTRYCSPDCQKAAWKSHKKSEAHKLATIESAKAEVAKAQDSANRPSGKYSGWDSGRKGDGPPLLPGPPGWLEDVEGFVASLGLPAHMMKFGESFKKQREMDDRNRYLNYLREQRNPRTFQELCEVYHEAGYDLKGAAGDAFSPEQEVTVEDLHSKEIFMPDFLEDRPPVVIVERKCEHCGTPTQCECICGESFCSKKCQKAERETHREVCEAIQENNRIATGIFSEHWWKQQGVQCWRTVEDM